LEIEEGQVKFMVVAANSHSFLSRIAKPEARRPKHEARSTKKSEGLEDRKMVSSAGWSRASQGKSGQGKSGQGKFLHFHSSTSSASRLSSTTTTAKKNKQKQRK
jgi:hypothetical protein